MLIAPLIPGPKCVFDGLDERIVEGPAQRSDTSSQNCYHATAAAKHDLFIDHRLPNGAGQDRPALADRSVIDAKSRIKFSCDEGLVRARRETFRIFEYADRKTAVAVGRFKEVTVAQVRTAL